MKPRVIAFVLAYKEKPRVTIDSLKKQTLPPERVVIVSAFETACIEGYPCITVPPDHRLTVGERVGIALNVAMSKFNLTRYDFILKLDDDVILPPRFIEINTRSGFDVLGRGAALLIRTDCFLKVLGGRWPVSPIDDTYLIELMMAKGCRVLPFKWVLPAMMKKEPKYNRARAFRAGIELYRLGIHPLRLLTIAMKYIFLGGIESSIAVISGYLAALLECLPRYKEWNIIRKSNAAYMATKIASLIRVSKANSSRRAK